MDFAEVVNGLKQFVVALLDILAFPFNSLPDTNERFDWRFLFLVMFIVTAIKLWVISFLLHYFSIRIATWLQCRVLQSGSSSGSLKVTRSMVQSAFKIYWVLLKLSTFFKVPLPSEGSHRIDFTSELSVNKKPGAMQWLSRILIILPNIIVGFVRWLFSMLFRWRFWLIALVAWWSVPQPKPNLWAISESIVNDAAKAVTTLNFSDILPWVPVVVLILVIIASIKTRSGYQWLLERYKQSYEIFYGLAYKARAVREPLNSVVEGASHIYTYCIIPLMVKEITNKRGRWIPGEGLSFPFPPVEWDPIYHRDYGNSTEPPWNLEQWKSEYRRHVEFTLELLEATQVMVDYYKEEVTGKNYQVFVDQIAPVPSFQLLDYLGFDDSKSPSGASVVPRLEWNRERIPFLGANLEKLTLNGLEEHILSKLNGLSSPTAKFVDLPQDEEPTQEMQDAVSKEVDNLMDMYRRTIVSACWFDEELRAIIRSAEKFARPSKWRTKLQAVISK